jgi:hypothetical protein
MKLGAEAEKSIAANIVSEIKTALQKTNGCISWERLASFIAGGENKVQPVSHNTLAKYHDYPLNRIARTFVHHSQVAAAI